jgi:putative FmdB family regulatory protein
MPMYEYACQDCGLSFAQKRKFAEASQPARCPECDSLNTRKLLATIAFISSNAGSIPVPMSGGGGCGCGGACACQN